MTNKYVSIRNRIFAFSVILLLLLAMTPGLAFASSFQQNGDSGLQVSGALLELNATPGEVYVHKMVVGSGAAAPAMDITIEARGFGESLEGSFLPLAADKDQSPYSALPFIASISKPAFHLDPGGSVPVEATIKIPTDIGANSRYAIIYIHSQPVDKGQGVTQILAASVPVVITPVGAQLNRTGSIAELKVNPVEAGKPIDILTTVQNSGNRHYKVQGQAKISDSKGNLVAAITLPLTSTSIIPTFSQQLKASYTALDRPKGLEPGTYKVDVNITLEDGTPLDSKQTTFEVTAPFQMCPGVDNAHMMVVSFENQEPGVVNGKDKTGVAITFENTGKVTGRVAICAYTKAPEGKPLFSDRLGDGGTGDKAIKYVSVRVDGFDQGVAHLAFQYNPDDLGPMKANSLILAYLDSGVWRKLDNLMVQTGSELVVGDQQVAILTKGPVLAMGGEIGQQLQRTPKSSLMDQWPIIALIAAVAVLLIIVIGLLFSRNKRDRSPSQGRR